MVERLAGIGAVGVRGNHDAAAAGGPEIEAFNPEARAGHGMDADADRAGDARVAGRPSRNG